MFKWLTGKGDKANVTNVVDGDTIDVDLGSTEERVRLIGLDCPEMNYNNPDDDGWANKAKQFAIKHLLNEKVVLRRDRGVDDRDEYGRLLRYIELSGDDFGEQILLHGLATVYGEDFKRRGNYRAAQHQAKVEKEGMWQTRKTRARDFIPGNIF